MKRFLILGSLGFFLGVLVGAFTHPSIPSASPGSAAVSDMGDSLTASQAYSTPTESRSR